MPRDAFHFRCKWPISQRGVDFVEERRFRSPFRNCEMRVEGCKMALVCQGVVLQLRNHLRNGGSTAKCGVFRRGGFLKHFAATKWGRGGGRGLRNGTRVPKGPFAEEGMRLRNHFATVGRFRNRGLGAAIAGALFRLWNFTDHAFSLLLSSSWFPASFFQFLCNSSWFLSFKKIKLHINNTN